MMKRDDFVPVVQTKCETCGGLLQVDSNLKQAVCTYCGTPYIVQDAINNFVTNIQHLHADVVNINTDISANVRLDAAQAFLKLREFDDAKKAFEEVCRVMPQEYCGWWGQVRAVTKDFTEKFDSKSALNKVFSLYESALVFAPEQEKAAMKQQFMSYYQPLVDVNAERSAALLKRLRWIEAEYDKNEKIIQEFERREYPQIKHISSVQIAVLAFIALAGIFLSAVYLKVFILILTLIPLLVGGVWEYIVIPIRIHAMLAEQKEADKKLENQYDRRERFQQAIKQIRQELECLL